MNKTETTAIDVYVVLLGSAVIGVYSSLLLAKAAAWDATTKAKLSEIHIQARPLITQQNEA